MKTIFNEVVSGVLTTIVFLLGGLDIALKSLLIVMLIDYLTGVASAIYNKKLNSNIGLKGILKKLCYLFAVAFSVVLDNLTGNHGLIRTLVIYFLVSNDGISILENLAELDVKLPSKLLEVLEQLKEKGD